MTNNSQIEAIQAVVDRVSSYQDGAPENTVEDELRRGFSEAGVDVAAEDVTALCRAIEQHGGQVSAADIIS